MSFASRPCDPERDYHLMRELVIDIYRAAGQPVYCLPGDLDWWLGTNPGGPADIQL